MTISRQTTKFATRATAKRLHVWSSSLWYVVLTFAICILASSRAAGIDGLNVHFIEGFSQPNRISNIAAATTGIVKDRVVNEGERVMAGACVLRLQDGVHSQLVRIAELSKEATGELEAARAELRSSTHRVQIIRELSRRGSATPDELLRAESDFEYATANVKSMEEKLLLRQAEYDKLLIESENYCVKAPFDGVLVEFLKQEGEFVGPSDPTVCVFAELSTLSVEFLVQRQFRPALKLGSEVAVHFVESDQRVSGRVYYISPFPNGETNTYAVKVRVDNSEAKLNAGERCQLEWNSGTYRIVHSEDVSPIEDDSKLVSEESDEPRSDVY